MIHIRSAGPIDAGPLADLLNEIIEKGGTTAMTNAVAASDLANWIRYYSGQNAWFLAEDDSGQVLGFQWIEPHEKLPPDACDIATFARLGRSRLGVGTALFERTRRAAADLGYRWINATIRSDNTGGLAYYQSRGFETYAVDRNIVLDHDIVVDKISKRFDL